MFQQKFPRNAEVTGPALQKLFDEILRTSNFPNKLKLAHITPAFKKNNPLEKKIIGLLIFYP